MNKGQHPRFADHIGRGEKPKYKSFLLRLHKETESQSADDGISNTGEADQRTTDLPAKRTLPHPKKRMQMYQEEIRKCEERKAAEDALKIPFLTTDGDPLESKEKDMFSENQKSVYNTMEFREKLVADNANCPLRNTRCVSIDQIPVNNGKESSDFLDNMSINSSDDTYRYAYSDENKTGYPVTASDNTDKFDDSLNKDFFLETDLIKYPIDLKNNNYKLPHTHKDILHQSSLNQNGKHRCMELAYLTLQSPERLKHIKCEQYQLTEDKPPSLTTLLTANNVNLFQPIEEDGIFSGQFCDSQIQPLSPVPDSSPRGFADSVQELRSPRGFTDSAQDLHSPRSFTDSVQDLRSPRGFADSAQDLRLPNSSRRRDLEDLISEVSSGSQRALPQLVPYRGIKTRRGSKDQPSIQRRRSTNGDQEAWQNGRRESPCYRPQGDHSSFSQYSPYGPAPAPTSAPPYYHKPPHHGGQQQFPVPPQPGGYGYSPPLPYSSSPPQPAPHPLSARDKTISWLSGGELPCLSPPPAVPAANGHPAVFAETESRAPPSRKMDDYKVRPMHEWQSRDVAHFLIEATHDLGIRYENADFSQLSSVDGRKLLGMEAKHLEKFVPSEGQRLYDYIKRHRNHELLTAPGPPSNQSSGYHSNESQHRQLQTPPPLRSEAPTNGSLYHHNDGYPNFPSMGPSGARLPETSLGGYDNSAQHHAPQVSGFHGSSPVNPPPLIHGMGPPIHPPDQHSSSYHGGGSSDMQQHMAHSPPASTGYQQQQGPVYSPSADQMLHSTRSNASNYESGGLGMPPHSPGNVDMPTALNKSFFPLHETPNLYSPPLITTNDSQEINRNPGADSSGAFQDPSSARPPSTYSAISEQVSDDSSDDEEEEESEPEEEKPPPPEPPKKRGPGRPPKPESERKKKKKTGRLWEFIRNLLLNPETCPSIVRWEDADAGIFRFVQSEKVAERWGSRKNNQKMNYEKLSRAMRYYYKGKVFEPVLGRRLVYRFGVNAKGWKPNNANFENPTS